MLLLVAVLAAGCGGTAARPGQPLLPHAVGSGWASEADAVAGLLDDGDGCSAHRRAVSLQRDVIAAVNARQVPHRLLEPLGSGVNGLVERSSCSSPPPRDAAALARRFAAWLRQSTR